MSDTIQNCNSNSDNAHYDNHGESVIYNQIGELYDYDIYYEVRPLLPII